MAGKNTAAFGIYRTTAEVDNAVNSLQAAGFRTEDISVLFPENEGTKDFAVKKNTKAPEGATTGAGTGAVLGGGLGLLAGIGALAIPGVGPFIAAGPIMATLAGAGAGVLWVESSEHWSAWASRNSRRSVMRARLRRVAFFCPSTVTIRSGHHEPRKC